MTGHVPVALAEPSTAAAARRGRRLAASALAGALVAVVITVVLIGVADHRRDELKGAGVEVVGVVDRVFPPRGRGIPNVVYRYAFDGRTHTGHSRWSSGYDVGQPVAVFVDRDRPERSTLAAGLPQSGLAYATTLVLPTLGLAALAGGSASLIQWRRRLRVLRSAPWQPRQLRTASSADGALKLLDFASGAEVRFGRLQTVRLRLPPGQTLAFRVAQVGQEVVLSTLDREQLALGRVTQNG